MLYLAAYDLALIVPSLGTTNFKLCLSCLCSLYTVYNVI